MMTMIMMMMMMIMMVMMMMMMVVMMMMMTVMVKYIQTRQGWYLFHTQKSSRNQTKKKGPGKPTD